MIKFVLRAASTLETTTGEQRTLHKFSAYFTRWFAGVRLVPSLCDYFTFRTPENFKTQISLMLYSLPPAVELEVAGINNTCVFSANVAGFT